MRTLARFLVAAAFAALPAAVAIASCGTDAVGVQACHDIEYARCDVAPLCQPGFDVQTCTLYYRDECLVGIQNTSSTTDPNTLSGACVAAINAVAACIDAGLDGSAADGGDGGCQIALAPDASCVEAMPSVITPCNLILDCPEALAACAFLAAVPGPDAGDAGTGGATGAGGSPFSGSTTTTATTSVSTTSTTGAGGTGGHGGGGIGGAPPGDGG